MSKYTTELLKKVLVSRPFDQSRCEVSQIKFGQIIWDPKKFLLKSFILGREKKSMEIKVGSLLNCQWVDEHYIRDRPKELNFYLVRDIEVKVIGGRATDLYIGILPVIKRKTLEADKKVQDVLLRIPKSSHLICLNYKSSKRTRFDFKELCSFWYQLESDMHMNIKKI